MRTHLLPAVHLWLHPQLPGKKARGEMSRVPEFRRDSLFEVSDAGHLQAEPGGPVGPFLPLGPEADHREGEQAVPQLQAGLPAAGFRVRIEY